MSIFKKVYIILERESWFLINRFKFKSLGRNSFFKSPLLLTHTFIRVDENVFVNYNARIEGVSSYAGIDYNPEIILDKNCTIQQNIHITCAQRIYIGMDTAIAANVTITDIHHPYEDIMTPIEKQQLSVSAVSIGAGCKIYNNAVILPGTTIGIHCTVGANSVVSGIIPDYCVVVGLPGRVVKRYNFDKKQWMNTDKDGNFY